MDYFTHSWLPFFYLYGVGGLFFLAGLIVIRRSGSIDLSNPRNKNWMKVLYFGFIWYMIMHGAATFLALQ